MEWGQGKAHEKGPGEPKVRHPETHNCPVFLTSYTSAGVCLCHKPVARSLASLTAQFSGFAPFAPSPNLTALPSRRDDVVISPGRPVRGHRVLFLRSEARVSMGRGASNSFIPGCGKVKLQTWEDRQNSSELTPC